MDALVNYFNAVFSYFVAYLSILRHRLTLVPIFIVV